MRKAMFAFLAIMMSLAILAPASRAQQDKSKRPSPPATADCKFDDGKTIHVDYSSPRMKGRKIYGELVPYGKVWRAGANEATTFVTGTNLTVGGKDVPAPAATRSLQFQRRTSGRSSSARKPASGASPIPAKRTILRAWT